MRFHCLGVPHTVTSEEYVGCAFTQKVRKFLKMMKGRGHHTIHYGHKESVTDADEHVTITDNDLLKATYGSYNWRKEFFRHSKDDLAHKTFNERAGIEIAKRKQPNDFVLAFWGWGVKEACDANPELIVVEPGIGYPATFARFKIFESRAIYNAYRGINSVAQCNQDWYEFVVPNYFDIEEFEYSDRKGDYVLALGRIGMNKGTHMIVEATKALGIKLVIAGQGAPSDAGYAEWPSHVEYVGYADLEKRKRLMADAKCGFLGSTYIEPFGGTSIEFALSGTPMIVTPWGANCENVIHNETGFHFQTYDQLLWALENTSKIRPKRCRQWAIDNFSLNRVGNLYDHVFADIHAVFSGAGWYQRFPGRDYSSYHSRIYGNLTSRVP